MSKFVIYQVLPRLFGNYNTTRKMNGGIEENGCGKFNSFTPKALKAIKDLGVTHIWYTGVIEHATQTDYTKYSIPLDHPAVVKGKAGSPYAIKDYYDVDPDLAEDVPNRMTEFEDMIRRTHKEGMKVIIDFVPNHVARQYHSDAKPQGVADLGENDHQEWAFSPLNNFYYIPGEHFAPSFDVADYQESPAKATGNDVFSAHPDKNDWYETVKLNYGIFYTGGGEKQFNPTPDTWIKMRDIVMYWAAKDIDGFRCDMAEMVPVEFWEWLIPQVKKAYPHIIFIAEVYQPALYSTYIKQGQFDYLYDKVGLYDTLRNVTSRNFPVADITHCWQNLNDLQDSMLNFLENHDEQRIASGFFSGSGMCAQPAMIVAATLTKAPVMIYAGQEFGELGMDHEGFSGMDGRTTIFDYWSVPSIAAWANDGKFDGKKLTPEQSELRQFYKKLLHITLEQKAITQGVMYDLEYAQDPIHFNSHEHFVYVRKYQDEVLLFVLNFDDKCANMRIRIPQEAFDFLQWKPNQNYNYIDLLQEEDMGTAIFSPDNDFAVKLPAWKGKIFKLTLNNK
ncbi:MAG: alpha-amylase family protein [Paludibacteraceae bacterium]|nr:alpha-amylase family protein [Paludibacteraceae bacterium]